MRRPAKWWFNERAFLLIEATLTGVVMVVGLACVSRAMSEPLHALSRIQHTDVMLQLAESVMSELEAEAIHGRPLARREGICGPAHESYRWTVRVQPAAGNGPTGGIPATFHVVTLTVSNKDAHASPVGLMSFWPSDWVQE